MTDLRLAVLMPVYNPGAALSQTLDTLRAQTVPFRLYLVDDGSSDKPDYQTLTRGLDCRVLELPQNVGVTRALNAGLKVVLAEGLPLVARMDNGDLCAPERFARQVGYLDQHPDIALVGSWVTFSYPRHGYEFTARYPDSAEGCARFLRYNTPIIDATMMVRAEVFRTVGDYPPEYPAAEGYALELMAQAAGYRMLNLPEVLLTAVELKESLSRDQRRDQLLSRLRLQWRFADWADHHTWAGLARTLTLMVMPITLLRRIKKILGMN
jgi:GT2 family glycosyltransferase